MNIQLSYNWLKEYLATKISAEEFAKRLSLSGPSVERLYDQAPPFQKMVVGLVRAVKPHPNADKLKIAVTDIGGGRVEEIVCGGTNLKPEMWVAVSLLGAKVRWHGAGELAEIKEVEIRGVKSRAMLAAANEIGLGEAFPHAEREILDLGFLEEEIKPVGGGAARLNPGMSLAEALGYNDIVFDIEVTSNRPDTFSVLGMAREAGAILNSKLTRSVIASPKGARQSRSVIARSLGPKSPFGASPAGRQSRTKLSVKVLSPKLCPRYQIVLLKGVKIESSPWWMRRRLLQAGIRPISNVVDITNYVMLEYGQPMHAFDAARLQMVDGELQIVIREATDGEKIKTLDGDIYELRKGMLVIADEQKPVAIAGIMGGEETGISKDTSMIVLESANFNAVSVRRTARALGLHTESSLRFEKDLPTESTNAALERAVELLRMLAGAEVASATIDKRARAYKKHQLIFRPEVAAEIIGVEIPAAKMTGLLKNLGFGMSGKGKKYRVEAPWWRVNDIEGERDLAEEIARLYGYHNLPSKIPAGEIPIRPRDAELVWEDKVKDSLAAAGYGEIITYSFVSSDELRKSRLVPEECLKLANPLSEDFVYMRPSLIPGTLSVIKSNEGLFPRAKIFEVSQVYFSRDGGRLPQEILNVAAAVYGHENGEELFRELKGLVQVLFSRLGVTNWRVERVKNRALWHPGRTVSLLVEDKNIGTVGEIHPEVLRGFGIASRVAMLDFDLESLLPFVKSAGKLAAVSIFPPVLRDLAFVVDERVEFAEIEKAFLGMDALLTGVELFDIYRGEGMPAGKKSLAFHLTFSQPDRTLTAEEVEKVMGRLRIMLWDRFKAEARS